MAQNGIEASEASSSKKMLALLEGLKRTSIGTVIYDQVARLVQEQEGVQSKVDHVYASLLHLLLDAYAREPTADHITRIQARLIQLRRPGLPAGLAPETVDEAIQKATAAEKPEAAGAGEVKPPTTAKPSVPVPQENLKAAVIVPGSPASQAERQVNSVYRLHLDRQHDEIEKLQEALARSVTDAVSQNREFGALLEIELRALQQAEGIDEIQHLRNILIGGLEELIKGQHSLDIKLHRTGGYLKLTKANSERLSDELNKVRQLSLTDEYTGLPNRRAFMRRLQDEISRVQRHGSPLVLAMIDLDEFKLINDTHGHAAGDAILSCFAKEVLTVLRHHDMVARYGGEEFAVLLPNTIREGAVSAINKAKNRARQVRCEHMGEVLPMPTFSTGIALYGLGESPTDFIDRADRALYRAKRLGRNRIELELPVTLPDSDQGDNNKGKSSR
ncbi:MAG: GGDEF domain-containing protein [Sulfuricaulis sp.]